MAKSGCVVVMIGFESLDPANLSQMKKGWSTRRDHAEAINNIKQRGIMIYGSFVLLSGHWAPALVLAAFMAVEWIPNMVKKDRSLSRYPEFAQYKARSWRFIPFIW